MTHASTFHTSPSSADPPVTTVVGIWSDRTILGHGVAAVLARARETWRLRWLGGPRSVVDPASLAETAVVVAAWSRPRSWQELQGHLGSWVALGTAIVLMGDPLPEVETARAEFAPHLHWCPPDSTSGALLAAVATAVSGNSSQGTVAPAPILSEQETRVVELIAAGWKVSAVARRLHVSPHTVHTYLRRIRRKFAEAGTPVASTLELYRAAMRWGLIDDGLPVESGSGVPLRASLESSA